MSHKAYHVKKLKTYITDKLTKAEMNEILRILAIDDIWFGRWNDIIDDPDGDVLEHWCYAGEDGHRHVSEELFGMTTERTELLINMSGKFYKDADGEDVEIGWIPAERIIPWEAGVVPTAINWFVNRFFGVELFGYQLFFYYQTTPKIMIVGGRGSAKTQGLAMAMAAWTAIHPGEKWAHFAYQGSQANEAYNAIIDLGSNRIPDAGQSEEEAPPSFAEVFIKSSKLSPYAAIHFNPWDIYDPGNKIFFRPLGHRQGATSTRSMSVQRASLDEVTHDLPDKSAIQVAEGTVRGINAYWKKRLPKEASAGVNKALVAMSNLDDISKRRSLTKDEETLLRHIRTTLRKYRLTTHLGVIRTGNRGPHLWVDEDLQHSVEAPDEIYARVVSYLINPHLDYNARRALEATYPDPAVARVELFAERAIGKGEFFTIAHLLASESSAMDDEMETAIERDHPGYAKSMYGANLIHWQLPYDRTKTYIMGGDPGTGMVPRRDSWVVQVWELDFGTDEDVEAGIEARRPVARLVYLRWGNVLKRKSGSWYPFLEAVEDATSIYHIPQNHAIIQVGGQERGILETAYGAHQKVRAINVSNTAKASWANWTRQLIAGGFLKWPKSASSVTAQLSDWVFKDNDLTQDLVMAMFAASYYIYFYFEKFINPPQIKKKNNRRSYGRYTGRRT